MMKVAEKLPGGANVLPKFVEPSTAEEKALYEACLDFESLLTQQMLSTMQSSSSIYGSGTGGEFFKSMFHQNIAKQIASNGDMGLARMMYLQVLKTQSNSIETDDKKL